MARPRRRRPEYSARVKQTLALLLPLPLLSNAQAASPSCEPANIRVKTNEHLDTALPIGTPLVAVHEPAERRHRVPLVVVAGHGGRLKPDVLPDRLHGCLLGGTTSCVYDSRTGPESACYERARDGIKCKVEKLEDADTLDIAKELGDAVARQFCRRPWLVTSYLHRSKLDPNRPATEAAQKNDVAERAWRAYHGFIRAAIREAVTTFGHALVVDIHGYKGLEWHPQGSPYIQYGYNIGVKTLGGNIETVAVKDESSVRGAASTYAGCAVSSTSGGALGESCPFDAMVRGNTSLAYYFGDLSYNLSGSDIACGVGMPGPKARSPHSVGDGLYFRGGYTVRHHSSLKADAVQVELPRCARSPAYFYDASDEEHNAVRQRLADQHARALYQWSVSHQASAWLVDDAWRDEVPPARRKETSSGIGWGLGATVAAAVTIGALRLFLLHSMCLMKRREHYASRADRSSRPEAELSARPSSSL